MSFLKFFQKQPQIVNIPEHIGIIMDGNGRWASKRGLPRFIGHKFGVNSVKKVVKKSAELGVKYLTIYTFSTENWKRPKEEVSFLMNLLIDSIKKEFKELYENNVRIRYIGLIESLPERVQEALKSAVENTKDNTGLQLILAINYGGRAEILEAIKKIITKNLNPNELSESTFREFLFLPDVPDPDLIIRTANEHRLSNFLLWQSAYSEFYFTNTLWPDFDEEHLLAAIEDYQKRVRKFGGIK